MFASDAAGRMFFNEKTLLPLNSLIPLSWSNHTPVK